MQNLILTKRSKLCLLAFLCVIIKQFNIVQIFKMDLPRQVMKSIFFNLVCEKWKLRKYSCLNFHSETRFTSIFFGTWRKSISLHVINIAIHKNKIEVLPYQLYHSVRTSLILEILQSLLLFSITSAGNLLWLNDTQDVAAKLTFFVVRTESLPNLHSIIFKKKFSPTFSHFLNLMSKLSWLD